MRLLECPIWPAAPINILSASLTSENQKDNRGHRRGSLHVRVAVVGAVLRVQPSIHRVIVELCFGHGGAANRHFHL
jgi:hypothetical protein